MDVFEKCAELIKAQREIYYNAYEDGKAAAGGGGSYDEGFEAGKQAEYDAFWDAYQQNGNKNFYTYAFYGNQWTDDIYKPKYLIKFAGYTQQTYLDSQITSTKVPIECSDGTTLHGVFRKAKQLKTIVRLKVAKDTSFVDTFKECSKLENLTLDGEIGKNGFDVQDCVNLSKDSIVIIINALSTTTTGLSITLSLTAVNNAFEGGSTGTEWLALAGTRNNWTINLV